MKAEKKNVPFSTQFQNPKSILKITLIPRWYVSEIMSEKGLRGQCGFLLPSL